jgi:hypothetical protein
MSSLIPVNMVTGFLGAGKTTLLQSWLQRRPPAEYWAVVVNEFGQTSFDGVLLGESGALIQEISGGCICCTNGASFIAALTEVLETKRPDRVLVEPSGLAHPALIVDALRGGRLRDRVELHAVVGLVRPDQLQDPRVHNDPVWRDQLEVADLLVLTHGDEVSPEQVAVFEGLVAGCFPRKLAAAVSSHGDLSIDFMTIRTEVSGIHDLDPQRFSPFDAEPKKRVIGWAYPPRALFEFEALQRLIQGCLTPDEDGLSACTGLRGVFRTRKGWLEVVGRPGQLQWQPLAYRRDSQIWVSLVAAGSEAIAHLRAELDGLSGAAAPGL